MRFNALASLAVAVCLAACAAAGNGEESSSSAQTEHTNVTDGGLLTDGSTPVADASVDAGSADGSVTAVDAGPAVPTYADEAPVIAAHCGACHGTQFGTLAKVQNARAQMIRELEQQTMPKDDKSWSTTPDGEAFLDFLQNDPELN